MEDIHSTTNPNPNPKKRGRDSENDTGSDEHDEHDTDAFAQMTRSQRKCQRERRRRSEVNKGFDDLTSLLWEVDSTTMRAEVESRAQRGKKQSNVPTEDILLSRVDLINFTISLIRRLHNENSQCKEIIATLTRPGPAIGRTQNLNVTGIGNMTIPHGLDTRSANLEVRSLLFGDL
jgi:hypothetical protein